MVYHDRGLRGHTHFASAGQHNVVRRESWLGLSILFTRNGCGCIAQHIGFNGHGDLALALVSAGSCEPALADAEGAARLTCLPHGRSVMDRLAVPATPYLALVDDDGTLRAALLPDEDTDLGAWLRQARTPLPMREERST